MTEINSTNAQSPSRSVTAIILCGGQGRRAGGLDKPLSQWHGRPLVEHLLDKVQPQVHRVILSANRNLDQYAQYGHVVKDTEPGFLGPLAGLRAALAQCLTPWFFVCAGDVPGLPADVINTLWNKRDSARPTVCHDGERRQHLHFLGQQHLLGALEAYWYDGGRSARGFLDAADAQALGVGTPACFRNHNRPIPH